MTSEVIVLKNGYSRMLNNNIMEANGTCSLIKTYDDLVLVDTLSPWDALELENLIKKNGYDLKNINYVVCTHHHPDHLGNLNLFTHKNFKNQEQDSIKNSYVKHIVGTTVYSCNKYEINSFKNNKKYIINSNIEIICTPGHTLSCISVIVNNVNNKGVVGLVGDLFENQTDLTNDQIWINAGSENEDLQRKNRQFILNSVDYIVPGHGEIFKVSECS